MGRRYGSHPLSDTCPLCDTPLSGGDQRTNPLAKWRGQWAHQSCVFAARGE